MAGRPPKPSHLKLVSGTTRSHKKGAKPNTHEPQPAAGAGQPPAHLSPRAREAWAYVSRVLDAMGVLTAADALALANLCEAYADGLEARASLANPLEVPNADGGFDVVAEGGALTYVTTGKSGHMLRSRPELALISDADRRFMAYLVQFGLTPAARSKVQTTDPAKADPIAGYFGG